MASIHNAIRKHIFNQIGLSDPVIDDGGIKLVLLLEKSEWSPDFEQLMRNRLIMGAMRYGKMGDPSKPQYDRISDILRRAKEYKKTGNDELLADIANAALLEYVEGDHPQKHFRSTDPEYESEHTESISVD